MGLGLASSKASLYLLLLIITQKFMCHLLSLELMGTNFLSHLERGHVLYNHHWNSSGCIVGGQ